MPSTTPAALSSCRSCTAAASRTRRSAAPAEPSHRSRLTVEVLTAVAEAIGPERTGVRLSPQHNIQGALETDTADVVATYTVLAEALASLELAFIDILHADPSGELVQKFRQAVATPLIANSGFGLPTTRTEPIGLIADDVADAVGIGRAGPALTPPPLSSAAGPRIRSVMSSMGKIRWNVAYSRRLDQRKASFSMHSITRSRGATTFYYRTIVSGRVVPGADRPEAAPRLM
ncbi:hypothetical protein AB0D13_33490 [Streptomyces sp. NPDC048430]|uniref:oxidoreductase n=1 Tax=Streptomyces sp. NPDC048430 TaxID=3155388 RepID=UPI00341A51E7